MAGLWEEKLKEEQVKTGPLEEVCAALREALDAEHRKRMDVFETKMKPIIIKDGPSKKVSEAARKKCALKLFWIGIDQSSLDICSPNFDQVGKGRDRYTLFCRDRVRHKKCRSESATLICQTL